MLRAFFDENNPLMKALSCAADLIVLNLLALLCSLPLVTAGAAYAALCDTCGKLARNQEGYLLRDYFRALKASLKWGSLLGLAFLLCAAVLAVDYQLAAQVLPPLRIVVGAAGFCVLAIGLYAFPLLARFGPPLGKALKNAALLSVGYFPRTAGMVVCTAALWLGMWNVSMLLSLLPLFGLSLPCYVCALLCGPVLDALAGDVPADGDGVPSDGEDVPNQDNDGTETG